MTTILTWSYSLGLLFVGSIEGFCKTGRAWKVYMWCMRIQFRWHTTEDDWKFHYSFAPSLFCEKGTFRIDYGAIATTACKVQFISLFLGLRTTTLIKNAQRHLSATFVTNYKPSCQRFLRFFKINITLVSFSFRSPFPGYLVLKSGSSSWDTL